MIELQNITKIFDTGTPNENVVFRNFSFTAEKGEFVSIVGSNGSGKTTLLNIISGMTKINSGKIILDGRDITNSKEHKRAARIGRVFQDPSKGTAPNMTIAENLALADNKGKFYGLMPGLNNKRAEIFRDLAAELNLGLENKMNVPVGSLSGGQRQALSLLIATMTPIDLLLLDEHTAALDPRTSEEIMKLTDIIIGKKHITTFMVTHNLRFAAEYGSRIVMMDKGRVIIDKKDDEKKNVRIEDLLKVFNEISIECGN
jgi:putative ABC transport system ATP-binding protein